MRLLILSDLHIEFGKLNVPYVACDAIILAGDIHLGLKPIEWGNHLSDRLDAPVILVAGNHEFYGRERRSMDTFIPRLRERAKATKGRVTFLENDSAEFDGIRFLGCTLWSDFQLFPDRVADAKAAALREMTDFNDIDFRQGSLFTPEDAQGLFEQSVRFLEGALHRPFGGSTIIITHHAPSRRSIPERNKDDLTSASFASHLDGFVEKSGAALWVHGHLHDTFDYRIGKTRVVCNPRGYAPHFLNPDFDPSLVVEI